MDWRANRKSIFNTFDWHHFRPINCTLPAKVGRSVSPARLLSVNHISYIFVAIDRCATDDVMRMHSINEHVGSSLLLGKKDFKRDDCDFDIKAMLTTRLQRTCTSLTCDSVRIPQLLRHLADQSLVWRNLSSTASTSNDRVIIILTKSEIRSRMHRHTYRVYNYYWAWY